MAGIDVKATANGEERTQTIDEGGFAPIGPFVPGEEIKVDVQKDGYDPASQTIVAGENVEFDVVGLNPTVSFQPQVSQTFLNRSSKITEQ